MFEYNNSDKEKKHFFDRSPKFWDKVVNALFIFGIAIIVFILVLNWLGYFS